MHDNVIIQQKNTVFQGNDEKRNKIFVGRQSILSRWKKTSRYEHHERPLSVLISRFPIFCVFETLNLESSFQFIALVAAPETLCR